MALDSRDVFTPSTGTPGPGMPLQASPPQTHGHRGQTAPSATIQPACVACPPPGPSPTLLPPSTLTAASPSWGHPLPMAEGRGQRPPGPRGPSLRPPPSGCPVAPAFPCWHCPLSPQLTRYVSLVLLCSPSGTPGCFQQTETYDFPLKFQI